jgi:hypothetical protein
MHTLAFSLNDAPDRGHQGVRVVCRKQDNTFVSQLAEYRNVTGDHATPQLPGFHKWQSVPLCHRTENQTPSIPVEICQFIVVGIDDP